MLTVLMLFFLKQKRLISWVKNLKKSVNFLKKQILKNHIGGEREHIFLCNILVVGVLALIHFFTYKILLKNSKRYFKSYFQRKF